MKKSLVKWEESANIAKVIEQMEFQGYELISIKADKWEKYTDNEGSEITDVIMYLLHFKVV